MLSARSEEQLGTDTKPAVLRGTCLTCRSIDVSCVLLMLECRVIGRRRPDALALVAHAWNVYVMLECGATFIVYTFIMMYSY